MRFRLILPLLLCLFVAWLPPAKSSAVNTALRVNEADTRVQLRGGQTEVALAVENLTANPLRARIELAWLDPQDRVTAHSERRELIAPGSGNIIIPLPLLIDSKHQDETLWYRLRYRLAPADAAGRTFAPTSGVISLSEIAQDIFELRVIASEYPIAGKPYRAHVRALHPITSRPVAGVKINADLKFDNDREDSFKLFALTNAQGYALLDFNLPRDLIAEDGTLEIKAARGQFKQEAKIELDDDHLQLSRIILTTDKPIYQPSQLLHIRALALDFSNRAIAGTELELEIEDPEGTTQFRADLKTSRFGVANIDWPIPDNTRLGDYRIKIEMDDDKHGSADTSNTVKISRYELPNFAVKTKPNRDYYLPGQNADVEIRADYLFGQPVNKGKVRIVREKERHWNYREQKWEAEETENYEGELDAGGRFTTRIDLTDAHEDFADTYYKRFEDLSYAAYVTDATTGRTEQKRFDLRVTREPIHIYVIGLDYNQSDALPLQFYLSASYADGTPAQCEIAIGQLLSQNDKSETEEPLRKVKTNRHGVTKVSGVQVRRDETEGRELKLAFTASDGKGGTGHFSERVWLYDREMIRVETNKAIYRPGEPLEIRLTASEQNTSAVLNLTREFQVLHSQFVQLRNGKATVTLPYRREFKDSLTISVAGIDEDGSCCDRNRNQSRSVIYPRDRELKLDVRLSAQQYRPGDDARADFRVFAPNGRPVESALGVSIVDRAVEERARTDSEFSRNQNHFSFFGQYFGNTESIAGVSFRDLQKLDLTQPISEDLQLAAEILMRDFGYAPKVEAGEDYSRNQQHVFSKLTEHQFAPLREALDKHSKKFGEYAKDRASLDKILNVAEINFDQLRDPWNTPYRADFSTERERDIVSALSAGADKKFDTADDFTAFSHSWLYFTPIGERIQQVASLYCGNEGRTTQDATVFKAHLKQLGLDFDELRDRWGKPYKIELNIIGVTWQMMIRSSGANGKFENYKDYGADDFTAWTGSVYYLEGMVARINATLNAHFQKAGSFPENESALRATLKANGIEFDNIRDAWGNGLYAGFFKRVGNRVVVRYSQLQNGSMAALKPDSDSVNHVFFYSRGADGRQNTNDDFILVEFFRPLTEDNDKDQPSKPAAGNTLLSGGSGAIKGIVTDPQLAALSGATLTLTERNSQGQRQTRSNSDGAFSFINLPPGQYELRCSANGFKLVVIQDISVHAAMLTELQVVAEVGTVSEAVVISSSVPLLQTQSALVSSKQVSELPLADNAQHLIALKPGTQAASKQELSTPRLREHFQETLVWQPQLETDKQGRAQLKFKLADNITTWKLSVIGSTVDGQIGFAEKEFPAFQPFFAEHDPPRVLTEGDEISLPVVLRNYLDKPQTVTAEMKPESWFALLGAARQRQTVAAGDTAKAVFDFRALLSVKDGKQRITAIGSDASDAIEKPVSVHPDGEEQAQTVSGVFANDSRLALNLPADAIKNSVRAELKIYPNLMAHALEGIEGILQRPHGCGEQTISSTYPNVMALRYLRQQDESAAAAAAKARRYIKAGYDRLLGYRAEGGGFSYWGRGDADLALTAYAVRFLNDAREFVDVDGDLIVKARDWLIAQQQPNGSWQQRYYSGSEDIRRSMMTTAYIARVLAIEAARADKSEPKPSNKNLDAALQRALGFLSQKIEEADEPYLIASYALAATNAGERRKAVGKLRRLAHDEAGTAYWSLESNTPFYGWGLAGRIETTALAVKALQKDGEKGGQGDGEMRDELVNRGLLFLLRNKDRYGVWLSTQATINVLETLIGLYEAEKGKSSAGSQAEVFVNGNAVRTVALPPGNQLSNPLTVELSSALRAGENRIEVRRAGTVTLASVQLVETHYSPWKSFATEAREATKPEKSSALRLAVSYDKPQTTIGEAITCNVVAERIGHRGYGQFGMMLAEIGLPPGADVDRASLEKAMTNSGWELSQYDVLPDRVVVYLWPRAGGTKFSFQFKLRYGIRAQSAPSVLYDYYNPEARAVIAPTRFAVR